MFGLGAAAGTAAKVGLGSKLLTGLNVAGGLSLLGGGMGLADNMYESAVKTGPQGLDDKYKIGLGRGLLGLFDSRFTQEGLTAGRNKYVMDEIQSTPGYYQRQEYGIRAPKLGESQTDYFQGTAGSLRDKRRQKSETDELNYMEKIREFARNDPDAIAARADAKTRLALLTGEMTNAREASNNQFQYLMTKEGRLEKQDFEARLQEARLNNRLASNQLQVSMAQIGLQKQDQANQMTMYNQKLADAKETRNLALIGATVDGLGMTLNGLFNRRG